MHALLLDLLAYTRLDFDPRTYSIVDSADLLHNVLGLLETQIQNTQAQIKSEAMPKIWGDRSQLLVLFQNLISNAIKFRTDQAPRIHLSARKQADGWLFSVRDEGLGIDPAYQKGIFEPFRRLSHQQDRYPGTGMGLAVCRRIVENHRGRIWFDSQPGRGSTFYFTLPANLEDMQT
jgi:chemotaxis family two-component system sensor kinase Cph1